jgi:integrase/recombinase XerD
MQRKRKYIAEAPHLTRQRGKNRKWYGYVPGVGEVALGTRDAAEAQHRLDGFAEERGGVEGGSPPAPPPLLTVMVMKFAESCRPPRYTPRTATGYLARLAHFVEWAEQHGVRTAAEVTFAVMSKYVKSRAKDKVGAATINRTLCAVSVCFKHCRREGLIATNPFVSEDFRDLRLREPRPKPNAVTLSPLQVDAALECADRTCAAAIAALLHLTAGSGIRYDEAHHVDIGDVKLIDEQAGRALLTITPKPGWTTKGYRFRDIPVSVTTAKAALEFAKLKAGAPTDQKTVWLELRRISKEAGLPDFSAHDLRRAWASAMHSNGASMKQVSVWLGHAEVQTTERYVRIFVGATMGHEFLPR